MVGEGRVFEMTVKAWKGRTCVHQVIVKRLSKNDALRDKLELIEQNLRNISETLDRVES